MESPSENIVTAIIVGSIIMIIMAVCMLMFFFLFLKKKMNLKRENDHIKVTYEQALLQTRLEIQEQTLQHVAREIHDNIGQVLSFIKLNLNTVHLLNEPEKQESILDSRNLISKVITDLRDLSKSLGMDHLFSKGLVTTIEEDLNRLRKSGIFSIKFEASGEPYDLQEQQELVVYRIFQESLNNIIKHSRAKNINIRLDYTPELFNLLIVDDGSGFNLDEAFDRSGSGLNNIKTRAKLLCADAQITSNPGEGCRISITLAPLPANNFKDGNGSGSIG